METDQPERFQLASAQVLSREPLFPLRNQPCVYASNNPFNGFARCLGAWGIAFVGQR